MDDKEKIDRRAYFAKYRTTDAYRISLKTPNTKYHAHKSSAIQRGIEWLFTFETWWKIWEPYFDHRGSGCNDLQMCRYGDKGPYSPENVRIDTKANNVREMVILRELRRKSKGGDQIP